MKTWMKPEMNVLDIKMSENIAASGDEDRPIATKMVKLIGTSGVTPINKFCAYYTDTMTLINTSIPAGSGTYTDTSRTPTDITNEIDNAGCHGGMYS